MKRALYRQYTIVSPRGNICYSMYRDIRYGDEPLVIILRRKYGCDTERTFIKSEDMNSVMYKEVMSNFKKWAYYYVLNSVDFDPKTDRIIGE